MAGPRKTWLTPYGGPKGDTVRLNTEFHKTPEKVEARRNRAKKMGWC